MQFQAFRWFPRAARPAPSRARLRRLPLVLLTLLLVASSLSTPAAAEPILVPSPPQPDGVRGDIGLGVNPFAACSSWWVLYPPGPFQLVPEVFIPFLAYDVPVARGLEQQPVFGAEPWLEAGPLMLEPYREGLALADTPVCPLFKSEERTIVGGRWVVYSPKGRVELTNVLPSITREESVATITFGADSSSGRSIVLPNVFEYRSTWDPLDPPWWLTSGRLPWELLAGLIQVGDSRFIQREPPAIPIVGDPDGGGVTYAALANAVRSATPWQPSMVLDAQGNVTIDLTAPKVSWQPVMVPPSAIPGGTHPSVVADVFWDFLQQPGWVATDLSWVHIDPRHPAVKLFHYTLVKSPHRVPWLWLVGLPITNPYWTRAKVGGVERWVLVQCFERRCLSYTPDNPDPWKVEFTNTGLHYYQWRYGAPWNAQTLGVGWAAKRAADNTYRRVE